MLGMGYAGLGWSNHWYELDLWLGVGLVRELRGCFGQAAVPTIDCKNKSGGSKLSWT